MTVLLSLFSADIVVCSVRAFQLSVAQRPKRLSLTVEDSKGEEQEVTLRTHYYISAVCFGGVGRVAYRDWAKLGLICANAD